ncbi:MAG: UPF0175 family protein [Bacteroidales bacterium]|nr:UPF0175 family protein [Bacteroidales bacterium]
MKNINITLDIPSDLLITLNKSEQEIKVHFKTAIAMVLFQEGKLTIGKATQLSGLSRYEFEKVLAKNKIPVSKIELDQVLADFNKIKDI